MAPVVFCSFSASRSVFLLKENQMQYQIIHSYRDNDTLRASFSRLAADTFGLDFEP